MKDLTEARTTPQGRDRSSFHSSEHGKEARGFPPCHITHKKASILRARPCTCAGQMAFAKEEMKAVFSHCQAGMKVQDTGWLSDDGTKFSAMQAMKMENLWP